MKVTCELALQQISSMAATLLASPEYGSYQSAVKDAAALFDRVRAHVEAADREGKYNGQVKEDDPGEYPRREP